MAYTPSTRIQEILFDATSRVTRHFPRLGARFLDAVWRPAIGNSLLSAFVERRNKKAIEGLRSFRRFLVIPDIHIGDAIMTQAAITALRDFFPEAQIDYPVNKTAFPLIEGNPEATRVLPFFSGGSLISPEELRALRDLARREKYDACWNFSPYVRDEDVSADGLKSFNIMTRSPEILKIERRPSRINHFIHHDYWFVREIISLIVPPRRNERFRGVRLTLRASAADLARRFVAGADLSPGRPVVLFNPDGASAYTRIPFDSQADLLRRLAGLDVSILLNGGHTAAGIGIRLRDSLPPNLRVRATVIPPEIPVDAYAAIIDLADVFISGDSGPLHMAAARRFSFDNDIVFRNRTAVLSCFGATPARMSGYDSFRNGFLPANQDAPSWTTIAGSPCRNITCLNKMFKTCERVRCFEDLDISAMVERIRSYLAADSLRIPDRLPAEAPSFPEIYQERDGDPDGRSGHDSQDDIRNIMVPGIEG
jgi:ADP-heptose:LPS heptosyltransferase